MNSEGYVSGQAPGFATALMGQITAFQGTPNDKHTEQVDSHDHGQRDN
ncbi:hypothetical protein [Streptomyces sp. NPDC097610]